MNLFLKRLFNGGKKYTFTGKIIYGGRTLHQIVRLSDGLVGGYIEKESNLSHEGSCFVYEDAKVYDDAKVSGNAMVYEGAKVSGNAQVYDDAKVSGNAKVCGYAKVSGNAKVCGYAKVSGNAQVYGYAKVFGNARVYDDAKIYGEAEVSGNAIIRKEANISSKKQWLNFTNLKYNLTIVPGYVFGGCRDFTHEEFAKLTRKSCQDRTWSLEELNAYKMCLKVWQLTNKE